LCRRPEVELPASTARLAEGITLYELNDIPVESPPAKFPWVLAYNSKPFSR
jgi:hypothetical protein